MVTRRKTAPLNIYVSPELKAAAMRAAQADQRSLTSLVEKLLTDGQSVMEAMRARRNGQTGQKANRRMLRVRRMTRSDQHRVWSWGALRSGHVATARKHAWRALGYAPWAKINWRLVYCALRGY